MEHTNSPSTVRKSEGAGPIPMGSPNSKSPASNFWNLGIPWVNSIAAGRILNRASPKSLLREFFIHYKIGFVVNVKFFLKKTEMSSI
jgi:hypothetical protein